MDRLTDLLSQLGLSQADLAGVLGMTPAALSYKISGQRPWRVSEANAVVEHLQSAYGVEHTLDDLFGSAVPTRKGA